MRYISALLSGWLFGMGLLLSGMANPAKVQGFLDLAGMWDPSLALVMVGAIIVAFPAFLFAKKHSTTCLGEAIQLPSTRHVTKKLIVGSLIFGVGWGLVGICPGPALVLAGMGSQYGWMFLLAMLVGMAVFKGLSHRLGS